MRPLGGSISRTAVGQGTGGGTSLGALSKTYSPVPDSFPRNFSIAANATWTLGLPFIPQPLEPLETHDLSIPLYACRTDHMHGDGGFINVTLNTHNVNLNSEECRNITRSIVVLERTFRVKSSREMKTPWSIPYTRRASYFSKRGGPWGAPASTTGTFTFATGQIYSDAVTLNMAGMGGKSKPELPGQIRANGNWFITLTTEAEAVEWLTVDQFSASSTNLAYDNDQDGVSNELELKMGTDPTQRNSDGSGYADGDQLNQGVLPPPDGLVMTTRQSEYQYSPEDPKCPGHPANRLAVETDIPVVNYVKNPYGAKLDVNSGLPGALATNGPFPPSAPVGSPMPLPGADAQATATEPQSEMQYTMSGTTASAIGNQRRVWGYTAELPTANFSRTCLKIRTEQQGTSAATFTAEVITLEFTPASKTSTNYVDLLANCPASSGSDAKVTEELHPVDFIVPDVRRSDSQPLFARTLGEVPDSVADGSSPDIPVIAVAAPVTDIDYTGKPGKAVTTLRVAKMESSLSASGALDPDRDLDHFRLRIKNLPDNTIASLKLRTQKSDGSTLDPATKISLTRTVGQQDFLTRSLLLVSDTNDDEESQATVGTDEADNDRTHLAELGSKIIVDSFDLTFPNSTATLTLPVTSLNAEVPIDPLRSFTIRVIRLSDCAIPMATIQTYITRLKERYAQVGITLNVPIPQEATVPVELTENNGQGSIILKTRVKRSPNRSKHYKYRA